MKVESKCDSMEDRSGDSYRFIDPLNDNALESRRIYTRVLDGLGGQKSRVFDLFPVKVEESNTQQGPAQFSYSGFGERSLSWQGTIYSLVETRGN